MALPPPFATGYVPSFVPNTFFNDSLKQLADVKGMSDLNVMLVDLTKQPKRPVGFGATGIYNGSRTRYIASIGKVAAMYAAFRLRKNFREAASEAKARNANELIEEVTQAWKPLVERSIGGVADFPQLKTIFSINGNQGGWDIQFTDTYYKRMEGMIGPSHNSDASYCILALGYQYIQGALAADGFYKTGEGGLWLTGDYAKGRDGPVEPTSRSHQVGNVGALAKLLVAAANQGLVKDSASSQMRRMMNNAFMFRILRDQKPSRSVSPTSFGKLGIGSDGTYHDAAIIERTTDKGTKIRYAAVILGSKGAGALWSAGKFLDDIVVAEHE